MSETPSTTRPFAELATVLVAMTCYGSAALTIDCLKSMEPEVDEMPGLKVGICENGTGSQSTNQLLEAIQAHGWQDWVYVHEVMPNRGFTGGTNVILRDGLAWPEPPDYFLLLNTDTIIQPGAIATMVEYMNRDRSLGLIVPQLIGSDGQPQASIFRTMTPITEMLRAAGTGVLNRLFGRPNFPLAVPPDQDEGDWVCLAAGMIQRETLEQVGLLDEGFFLYFDDCDYGWRVRRAGGKVGICRSARIIHLEGGSNDAPEARRLGKRRAPYYYAARARHFAKLYGRCGLYAANLGFMLGQSIAWVRETLGNKQPHLCAREARDNWINARSPLSLSEPKPWDDISTVNQVRAVESTTDTIHS